MVEVAKDVETVACIDEADDATGDKTVALETCAEPVDLVEEEPVALDIAEELAELNVAVEEV